MFAGMSRIVVAAALTFTGVPIGAQTLELEPKTIVDGAAVHRNAMQILVPKGWQLAGGVKWYPDHAHQACLETTISNPAGSERIESFPFTWFAWYTNPVVPLSEGQNYMGSVIMRPIEDPREVIANITLRTVRRGARIAAAQDLPEVASAISALIGARVRSARIRIEYEEGGRTIEEDFYLSLFITSTNLGVNNCVVHSWGPAWIPFSLRAEKGRLDAATPLMLATVNSLTIDPSWFGEYSYVCDLFRNRMNEGVRLAGELSEYIRRNSEEIRQMHSDSYWKRQASQDRISRNFSNYVRGVELYTSPHEKHPVQLPGGYRNVWVSETGVYHLSNDDGYDPGTGSTANWQRIRPAR